MPGPVLFLGQKRPAVGEEDIIKSVAQEGKRLPDRTDKDRIKNMADEEVLAAALDDPDNPPLTQDQLSRMKVSRLKRDKKPKSI